MPYMSQEHKKRIAAQLKMVMPKTWKWSLSVENYSTIVLNIKSAPVDLLAELDRIYNAKRDINPQRRTEGSAEVNPHWFREQFDQSLPLFERVFAALNLDNHNNSDPMSDYYDVGHYVAVKIGRWNKPFEFTGAVNA